MTTAEDPTNPGNANEVKAETTAEPAPEVKTEVKAEPAQAETTQAHVVQAEPEKIEPEIKADEAETPKGGPLFDVHKLDILNDLYVSLTIEVGRAQIKIRDLLSLTKGSIIELNKLAGEPVDVYANGKLISTGNIITANGKYCVRLTSISDAHKKEMEKNEK